MKGGSFMREPNNNHKSINKDEKRLIMFSIAIGFLAITMAITKAISNKPKATIQELMQELPSAFGFVVVCLVFVAIIMLLVFWALHIDFEPLDEAMKIYAEKLKIKRLTKNAQYVYTQLQGFLYYILRVNYSILNIPVENEASLIPKGTAVSVHNGCITMQYEIICPNRMLYDDLTLKSILNGFIGKELYYHSICGLAPSYKNLPSVYIDRVFYDGINREIVISAVYINDEASYEYCKKSFERDRKEMKNGKAIYRLLKLLSDR